MIDPLIELIRGVETLNLNNLDGYVRLQEDGLGLPAVRRLTERGPAQHGDTDIGFRLEPRIVNLVVGIFGSDPSGYWAARRSVQRLLKPSSVPLALRYTLPTGDVRQLDVVYGGGLSWGSSERFISAHRAGFQLRAADPTFYDPSWQSIPFGISGASGNWAIPWPIPWPIGSATVDQTQAVVTDGEWRSYPIITARGPIDDLVIYNETTNEKLDFTGHSILSGDTLTIDTRYGVKSVVDQDGVSQIAALSDDSDLATFHLDADPDAAGGVNSIRVTGSGADSTTIIYFQFQPRYIAL